MTNNNYGEVLMLLFGLSLWRFGPWPIWLPWRWWRRRRQEKRLVRLIRRTRGDF